MAVKFKTNAEELGKVFSDKITVERMSGWASAGLVMVMKGDYTDGVDGSFGFTYYVQRQYLSQGYVLGVGPGKDEWGKGKDRGWHHYETFTSYLVKPKLKGKKPEAHAGMYGSGINQAGGNSSYLGSLNYMKSRIKAPGYIKDAWKSMNGNQITKDALAWEVTHGIAKLSRVVEGGNALR